MYLTSHAIDRIQSRLNHLVTCQDVLTSVTRVNPPTAEKTFIEVKRLEKSIEIPDPEIFPDGIARGDSIVAICKAGQVKSVILRKSWSQSKEYKIIPCNFR